MFPIPAAYVASGLLGEVEELPVTEAEQWDFNEESEDAGW